MKKVLHVVATRPNYIKASPVINSIDFCDQIILNTGQHYDSVLSTDIMKSLNMRKPDINLSIPKNYGTFERLSFLLAEIPKHIQLVNPDMIVVYGDVDSTAAAAIVASRLGVPIAHVESGLRSFDNTMPEELNRRMVDSLASLHFVTEKSGVENLKREGHADSIFFVGNSMIDSLKSMINSENFKKSKFCNDNNILFTCHRPSNVDCSKNLQKILDVCGFINKKIVWPLHPRTEKNIKKFGLWDKFTSVSNLELISPLNYCDFVKMMSTSKLVITDSGGVQEETTYLKVPCLTIRENTERPVTITDGSNRLVSYNQLVDYTNSILQKYEKSAALPVLWDGNAGKRISDKILLYLNNEITI